MNYVQAYISNISSQNSLDEVYNYAHSFEKMDNENLHWKRIIFADWWYYYKYAWYCCVTADSMSNRLASLALGTSGIDFVYHFAFYELVRAVKEVGSEDATETLETLVQGKRLKDISDLPLDLTV